MKYTALEIYNVNKLFFPKILRYLLLEFTRRSLREGLYVCFECKEEVILECKEEVCLECKEEGMMARNTGSLQ